MAQQLNHMVEKSHASAVPIRPWYDWHVHPYTAQESNAAYMVFNYCL